jgi:hypothetical protein
MADIRAVNVETGEDLSGQYRLVNVKQAEAYAKIKRDEEARMRGRSCDFTFSVMDALHEVTSVLTNAQCGYMLVLQGYTDYKGRIVKTDHKTLMKPSDMAEVLGLANKRSTFYDFLSKVIDNEIMIVKDDIYSINQRYHFRGPMNGRMAVQAFTQNIRKAYLENKPEDLGLFYRMLPFVNVKYNTLCHNPDERIVSEVKPLKAKELAEICGIKPATLSRRFREWSFNDRYILAKVTIGHRTQYMFNPFIIYRGKDMSDDTAKGIFDIKSE